MHLPRPTDRLSDQAVAYVPPLELAVIIPTFNECDNVAPLIDALDVALADRAWEAIFVDDASTDGTTERIAALAARRRNIRLIHRIGRRGLSTAVIEGMLATVAPVVAVIDGDMQHDEQILPALHDAILLDGADVAIGTRYAPQGSTGDWDEGRVKVSRWGTKLAHLVVRAEVSDPLSGFFVARRDLVVETAPRLSTVGFKILIDLLASAPRPLKIAEVPYRFRSRHAGRSKLDSAVALEYIMLLADKMVGRFVPPRLIMFTAVGGLGLIVHLALLALFLLGLGGSFRASQALAVTVAIAFNFMMNNVLTYYDRRLHGLAWWKGLASFYLVCGLGAIANVGIGDIVYDVGHVWWAAGIAGAAVGAVWNYASSSFLTWKKR